MAKADGNSHSPALWQARLSSTLPLPGCWGLAKAPSKSSTWTTTGWRQYMVRVRHEGARESESSPCNMLYKRWGWSPGAAVQAEASNHFKTRSRIVACLSCSGPVFPRNGAFPAFAYRPPDALGKLDDRWICLGQWMWLRQAWGEMATVRSHRHPDEEGPDSYPTTGTLPIVEQGNMKRIDAVSASRVDLAWGERWVKTRVCGETSLQIGSFR